MIGAAVVVLAPSQWPVLMIQKSVVVAAVSQWPVLKCVVVLADVAVLC